MATIAARPRVTIDEFLADDDRWSGYELVHGEPEENAMGAESGWIGGRVSRRLAEFCEDRDLGWVFPAEVSVQIWPEDPHHLRKPDAMFISRERLPRPPSGPIRVVPDLVVEVVSPGDLATKLDAKLLDYRHAGIPRIWVIYPETRRAYSYRGTERPEEIDAGGALTAPEILPGFALPLADLFARLDETGPG